MKLSLAAKGWLFAGCAAGALTISGTALAQDDGAMISEIVVTAQRRAEKLEDVPMSITAVTAESIATRGVTNMQDLGQIAPGVQIGFQGSFTYPAIRGVSSATTGVGKENNVGVYIDGYYQPDVNSINQDFANIESIQVLKGPQGALYGRNATGGAILITTPRPSETLTGKIEAKYGNLDEKTLSGFISGPLSDRIGFSLAGYVRDGDGYYDLLDVNGVKIGNAAPIHNYSARAKLQADVTDDFKVTLGYNFNELEDARGSMFTVEANRGTLSSLISPRRGRLYQPRTFAGLGTSQLTITNEGTLTMEWATPIGKLTSYTGYAYRRMRGNFDFDGSPVQLSFNNTRYIEDTFQQGLDLNIDSVENLALVVGVSYYDDRTKTQYSEGYSGNRLSSRQGTTYITKAWAIYADGTYDLTDRLSVSAGARYTEEMRKTRFYALTFPSATYSAAPLGFDPKKTFANFSPRATIRYKVAEGTNVYASVSKGFRSGFIEQVPGVPVAGRILANFIQPEKITAYELGFKTAQRRFRFDASAFYYDDKNFHVGLTIPNPANPNVPFNITSNAAKAEIYGVEAQAEFEIVENLNVSVGAAYVHARFKEFPNAQNTGLNTTTGVVVAQSVSWNGLQMNRAPDFSATLGLSYKVPEVFGGNVLATTNVKYTDSYVPNNASVYGPLAGPALANKQRFREDSYTLVNASLTWTDPTDRYEFGVYANNIFDVDYHLSLNGSPSAGDYGTWAPPRTYGMRAAAKF